MSNPIDAQAKARIARGRRRMNHADLIVARIERARQDRGISVAELDVYKRQVLLHAAR